MEGGDSVIRRYGEHTLGRRGRHPWGRGSWTSSGFQPVSGGDAVVGTGSGPRMVPEAGGVVPARHKVPWAGNRAGPHAGLTNGPLGECDD